MASERRRYRRILTRIWADEKFMALSRPQPNGQTLWHFLLTGPHTTSLPGLFTAGEAGMAETLRWPLAGFRKAWLEIESRHMAAADWTARVVWIPKAILHNAPESPNVVKGWRHPIDEIPECALKRRAVLELEESLRAFGEPFMKAFHHALHHGHPRPLLNQEQEQEQEQEPLSRN